MKRPRKCDIDDCVKKVMTEKAPRFFTTKVAGITVIPNNSWIELPLADLLGGALNTHNGFVGKKGRWTRLQLHLRVTRQFVSANKYIASEGHILLLYRKPGCGAAYLDYMYAGGDLFNPAVRDQFELLHDEHIDWPYMAYPNQWIEAPTATFTVSDYRTFPLNQKVGIQHLELSLDHSFTVDRDTGLIDDGEIVILLRNTTDGQYEYSSLLEYVCED